MAMTPARVVLTYRDYEALPNDGRRYEIHEGELSVTAAPRTRHQEVSIRLASALHVHVTSRGPGKVFHAPTAVILSDISVVEPDIVYVASDRLERSASRGSRARRRSPSRSSLLRQRRLTARPRDSSTPGTACRGTGSSIPMAVRWRSTVSPTVHTRSARAWALTSR